MVLARRPAVAAATGMAMAVMAAAAVAGCAGGRSEAPAGAPATTAVAENAHRSAATVPSETVATGVEPAPLGRPLREGTTALPTPRYSGTVSVEAALARRRSVRAFADRPLTTAEISQLLWSAQGVTSSEGFRTSPSAGALYPLELYVATAEGVAHYVPAGHLLEPHLTGDRRSRLSHAALDQPAVAVAPAVFVITGVAERTRVKYGDRGDRFVWIEAGHAAQNLLLQATALGLAGVPIGGFSDTSLLREIELPGGEVPLYLIPIGAPR